jgi:hypothetical protein
MLQSFAYPSAGSEGREWDFRAFLTNHYEGDRYQTMWFAVLVLHIERLSYPQGTVYSLITFMKCLSRRRLEGGQPDDAEIGLPASLDVHSTPI